MVPVPTNKPFIFLGLARALFALLTSPPALRDRGIIRQRPIVLRETQHTPAPLHPIDRNHSCGE